MTRTAATTIARMHINAVKAGSIDEVSTHKTIDRLAYAIRYNTLGYISYIQRLIDKAIEERNDKAYKILDELYVLTNNPEYTKW